MKKTATLLAALLLATSAAASYESVAYASAVEARVDKGVVAVHHGRVAEDGSVRGIFIDKILSGARTVTGIAAVEKDIVVKNEKGVVLGQGKSDENGRFSVALSRSIQKGEKIVVEDASQGAAEEVAVAVASEGRAAYVRGKNNRMRPDDGVSRAEVAMMLARLRAGRMDIYGKKKTGYKDASHAWFTTAVDDMSRIGVLKGYPGNSFRPHRNMSRGEFAAVLSRMAPVSDRDTHPFTDAARHWSSKSVGRAYNAGYLQGYPDGRFQPEKKITRAEAVAILNRAAHRNTAAASFRDTRDMHKLTGFIDVRPDHWAYFHILDAANDHRIGEKSDAKDVDQWIRVE
ncbi:Endoglucanase precursor [Aedoeadaptatus ivorii]|uniref:Endoglucanase n=1 Tax=Aedoeadaptatus ivorii TaxID=54006 RepID=A0A3S5C236_9FIRM|nr:S-layer homology domain-containing protein [Peptoniphilus ivorii]VEJ34650.1 Endoglucanase precursor [Peptoniphilus ivorii]